jgi:hypothetical protein
MAYAYPGAGALDYFPCRYGASKLQFRGPQRALQMPYGVVVGGTETYGKFVPEPYPALVEGLTGLPMVNLGCVNAGPDVFLNEPEVFEITAGAAVTVVQVMGAQNLTNRFYAVHPRRNDRFLRAAPDLQAMYPEVDFTEFHFTRHLLRTLRAVGADRFEVVAEELRAGWVRRMTELLARIGSRVILLWLADHPPPAEGAGRNPLRDPILVDAGMIAALKSRVAEYAEVVISARARAEGLAGMSFGPLERPAALEVPGPAVHREAATALAPRILRCL